MKIAIVGAGIGGLTAAALLQEQGHQVKIFEKNDAIREVGAGIGIGDNVIQKLHNHDLAKGIKNAGQNLTSMQTLDEHNKPLMTAHLKRDTLNVTLSRQTLISIIQSYVQQDSIYLKHGVTKIDNSNSKVILHFMEQESEAFDLCIGADGIHSIVREAIDSQSKVQYQGYTCFRGLVDDIHLDETDVAKEFWGKQGRVGIVPLIDNQAYWFIIINAKEKDVKYQSFGKPHLQARFNHYPNIVRQILDKQSETGIILNDIYDMKPLKSFVKERTILLGDAAHATTPNMGQGAGQAMEDAIVLANCLKSYDFNEALERYDKLRVNLTAKVIKKSRKIGKIAQYHNSLMIKCRNTMMKILPNKIASNQTKFLYKSKEK
ncbi:FAD-dependent monooxygenase [Staphylococcus warneri]|uniref:FAD-dependent monooxygenase n=1 Tax=Staphylococcus warneri TaxID=1292 RepID=UPI002DBF8DDD|nr:FAD-dependent monooxygenase [Staphylococcus warneri]MEC0621471.1 FAD-dependent monooxygenase [Staphylococcus warneri]